MPIPAGEYQLDPGNATLRLAVRREGLAAAIGHDLTMTLGVWSASVRVGAEPAECRVSATFDLSSLEIVEAHGGAMPITDGNRGDILINAAKALGFAKARDAGNSQAAFEADRVEGSWEQATIGGVLTLHGSRCDQEVVVGAEGEQYRAHGVVRQSRFGIKPFSAMMGALKVRDDVEVEIITSALS